MGRLAKLKREIITEANKRILNEQGIDPKEYPLHRDNKMINSGETTTSLGSKVKISREETKDLEDKIAQLELTIERASADKEHKEDMLDELMDNLKSNKTLKRILKRKEKELEKELKKVERLENADPVLRKKKIKEIGAMIAGAIAYGLGGLFVDSKSDNPKIPFIIGNLKDTIRRFTSGG